MKQILALVSAVVIVIVVGGGAHPLAAPTMVTVSIQRLTAQSDVGKRANQQLERSGRSASESWPRSKRSWKTSPAS